MPHFFHILHIGDDAINDRSGQVQDSFLGDNLVSDVDILLIHTDHLSWLFRFSDNGWECAFRSILASDAHLYESGSAVDNECRVGIVHEI